MTFYLFLLLLAAAWLYQLLALISLARFFFIDAAPDRNIPPPLPGVTIFKPLKGLETDTRECLVSFLTQEYRPYQVLFGVGDPQDPVISLLKELQDSFSHLELEILICPLSLGLNPKISTLRQLEPRARYDLWVLADADVRVAPDWLSRMVAALREPGVGLVCCPYRAGEARTLGARLEALTIAADFIPSVATAHYVEGIRFGLGATMALPRQALARIGGLEALADFLADDYQLGWRMAQAGLEVRLLPHAVETHNPEMSLRAYLSHQLRWARTYRICRPGGYLAYGVTHALVYSVGLLPAAGGTPFAWAALAATLALRGLLAYLSQRRCLKGPLPLRSLLLLPLKDLLAFGLWVLSFTGNRVSWKDRTYRVTREGKLIPA